MAKGDAGIIVGSVLGGLVFLGLLGGGIYMTTSGSSGKSKPGFPSLMLEFGQIGPNYEDWLKYTAAFNTLNTEDPSELANQSLTYLGDINFNRETLRGYINEPSSIIREELTKVKDAYPNGYVNQLKFAIDICILLARLKTNPKLLADNDNMKNIEQSVEHIFKSILERTFPVDSQQFFIDVEQFRNKLQDSMNSARRGKYNYFRFPKNYDYGE